MDRRTNKSISEYAEAVRKEFPSCKIILYGSFAGGGETEDSDIDIAVIVDKYDGDLLKANSRLFALARDYDVRIEPILMESDYDKSGFIENIVKEGKVIYSA